MRGDPVFDGFGALMEVATESVDPPSSEVMDALERFLDAIDRLPVRRMSAPDLLSRSWAAEERTALRGAIARWRTSGAQADLRRAARALFDRVPRPASL